MVGWHHWLHGHEFELVSGVGDGQEGLVCCSPWGCKESDTTEQLNWTELVTQTVKNLPAMPETWVWSLGQEDPLEKEMATHFSTLAWKISWPEEPSGLQSMGSRRVRHDWPTLAYITEYNVKMVKNYFLNSRHCLNIFKYNSTGYYTGSVWSVLSDL